MTYYSLAKGNLMERCFAKAGMFFLCLCFPLTCFSPTAAAQSLEELQTLRLFYSDQELVVSPTRSPKPLSRVAENITVIKAKEIEEMNAHTVAEVLNRVPGLFIDFNQDFGATSLIQIQGSQQRHVLVLVDGIPWNFLSEGHAETNSLPVGIIERIEIIKGPASSAWGSSLGGVINILTREAGQAARPTGTIQAAFGERSTRDLSGQIAGLAGPVGYYLFAGRQDSDGLRADRQFDAARFFGKFNLPLAEDADLNLSMGFSNPQNKLGDFASQDLATSSDIRSLFLTASLEAALTPELDLNLSLYTVEQKADLRTDTLGLGLFAPAPQFFSLNTIDEESTGARGKLVWTRGRHTAVLGIDADRGKLEQTLQSGPFLQAIGQPATATVTPAITKWALYANDTLALGRWSLTPGLRYDYNSIIGSFVSPSLGLTRRLGETSLLRASAARGFTLPPLAATAAGGLFLLPNPTLQHESTWSYQAGLETTAARWLWLKGTVFYHDLSEALKRVRATPPPNTQLINQGAVRRQGLELEAETLPWHDFTLAAGLALVHIAASEETESRTRYAYNLKVKYDDRQAWRAQLFGHYVWWDALAANQGDYGNFIWDLNGARKIKTTGPYMTEIFFTVHNLLNGDQYPLLDSKNPARWLEAGLKVTF